jgi:hypothetical protein
MQNRYVKAALALILTSTLLSGCASDIMQGYVGQSLETAMARYGPPDVQFDLPDGRRAFQWIDINTTTSSGHATERVSRGRDGPKTHVDFTPASTTYNRCFYTMYARYDQARRGWIFDGFEPPALGC